MADKKKRKRKPLTPEQKERKRQRERERYHAARRAGFSPDQARSIKRTIQQMPEIVQEPSEALLELAARVRGLADMLEGLTQDVPRSGQKRSGKRKSGRTSAGSDDAYRAFVERMEVEQPGLSAKELRRRYRAQGGKIGNEKALEIVRDVRGNRKQETRITRWRYYSNREKPVFGDADKRLIKDRYMYLMKFETVREDAADTFEDYVYVASNRELTLKELREHVMDIWADGFLAEKEKYTAVKIIPESIALVYAVDTKK